VSELVLRTALAWLGLLVLVRLSGRRTLGEMSAVDLIALLIIGDVVTQGLNSADQSLAGGFVVVMTLLLLNVGYSYVLRWLPSLEGAPTLLVREGEPLARNLRRARVDLADVLASARRVGVPDLSGVRYAVLEVDGTINVVPRTAAPDQPPPR